MSELIDNRQQRIQIMKSLVRQLHNGSQEEKIRRQLEVMLDEADYSDVFEMEVQLIEEGISEDSIRELCDTHTRVLSGHLDLQETPETIPGHPVHTFIEENWALTKQAQQIRLQIDLVNNLAPGQDSLEEMREIQSLLNELMDVDKLYRRKENLLFPFFEKQGLTGPPTVMWGKHDQTRSLLKGAIQGLTEIDAIQAEEAQAYCLLAVTTAVNAVEDMIYKDEKILFPTALDLLSEEEWYQIYQQSPEIGYCLYVPEFEWQPEGLGDWELESTVHDNGRIQMPTGAFKLQELISAFSVLPLDITFVDREDTVRYFSPGVDRVFDRSRAILGRKVQYCHPPKSVRTVNRILNDFKAGDQDQARFWIQMGGRKILIKYYALRDSAGSYLGTLEVTQDITDLQSIQGERRLLSYDDEETEGEIYGN